MRSIHVAASVAPQFGGPAYNVTRLIASLRDSGAPAELHAVKEWGGSGPASLDAGVVPQLYSQDFANTPVLRRLCLSRAMLSRLSLEARHADILHSHGLWLMPNLYAAIASHSAGKPLILSPRGMLAAEALKVSAWQKHLFWRLFQQRAAEGAACIHATSESEYSDIRRAGLLAPVAIVPNGIDLPDLARPPRKTRSPRTLLSLGRLHPIKGLDRLVSAWGEIESSFADWRLVIAGDGDPSYRQELEAQARRLGSQHVHFVGARTGAAKNAAFAEADIFVLPSLSENFATTVAEALAAGVPVVASQGSPWAGVRDNGCGWWVDAGPSNLAKALTSAMTLSTAELANMGARGRAWMARDYSWTRIATELLAVYEWLGGRGERPQCVQVN